MTSEASEKIWVLKISKYEQILLIIFCKFWMEKRI